MLTAILLILLSCVIMVTHDASGQRTSTGGPEGGLDYAAATRIRSS
jgi:hypothetical protein